jgi:predicted dehydrogenase
MKVCVIGVGRMGRRHIAAARGAGFELAGVFDQSPGAIEAPLEECNVARAMAYNDAVQMLRAVRPSAAVIATTASSHCEYVRAAANDGECFILCKKPMASSLEECDRMIDACRAADASLAINHQMRFMEQYTEIETLVATPEFGGLRSMVAIAGNFGLAGRKLRGTREVTKPDIDSDHTTYKAGLRYQAQQAVAAARGEPANLATIADSWQSMKLVVNIFGLA